jgi:hypothetical protein
MIDIRSPLMSRILIQNINSFSGFQKLIIGSNIENLIFFERSKYLV